MFSHSGSVIPNFFTPFIGHMIKIENFLYKVGEIFILFLIFHHDIVTFCKEYSSIVFYAVIQFTKRKHWADIEC